MKYDDRAKRLRSVLVLCANYYSAQDTEALVHDLLKQESAGLLRVVVVDNSAGDSPESLLSYLAKADPRASILHPGHNLGYFGAAAWGLRQYLTSAPLPDWVIVSNADITLQRRDFFTKLFALHQAGDCAVIAPAISSSLSGKDQNPHLTQRPSCRKMRPYKWIFRYYSIYIVYQLIALYRKKQGLFISIVLSRAKGKNQDTKMEARVIYAPHGSFILFHRSYFEAGGTLEYRAFLFGEEIFVAETVRRLGLRILYDPRLEVIHREHNTTGIIRSRKVARYQWQAAVYCADTFFGCATDSKSWFMRIISTLALLFSRRSYKDKK